MNIRILQEANAWIAVYKPAGLAVQSGRVGKTDLESEVHKLLAAGQRPAEKAGAARPPYLAVIHRLDQPVEGIVLFAKTPRAAAALSAQLQQHRMTKEYLACVHSPAGVHTQDGPHLLLDMPSSPAGGPAEQQWHRLCDWLVRDGRSNSSRVAAAGTQGAKKSRLDYRVLFRSSDTAVLEVRLLSGRHHQIRVQMAHAGMPIIGDRKYGDGYMPADCHSDTCRFPALCARRLSFADPDSQEPVTLEVKPENLLLKQPERTFIKSLLK